MKWIDYGAANAVSDYDLDPALEAIVFYRYAYLDFVSFKQKSLLHTEVDLSISKHFYLAFQLGGDSLVRLSGSIYRVGFEISIWSYN